MAPPRSLALRTRVARSGLLEVPGDRYIDRRFAWRSASSCSFIEDEVICPCFEEPDKVGGWALKGWAARGVEKDGFGLPSIPNKLTSTLSLIVTVPSWRNACSKSRSEWDVRRCICLFGLKFFAATGDSLDGCVV